MRTNAKVSTPLGEGISQGPYVIRDSQGDVVSQAVLVRLPVNDQTRSHLNESNCLTPRANRSALFIFPISESGHICKDAAQLLNCAVVVLVVLFCILRSWPW